MRGLPRYLVLMALVLSPLTAYADIAADIASENTNGTAVSALQNAITTNLLMLNKEVGDIAYSVYQQGRPGEDVSNPYQSWLNNHIKLYCSPNITAESNTNTFACQAASGSPASSKYQEMGDIKASVLLGPTVYTEDLEGIEVAAQDFIRTVINPYPSIDYAKAIAAQGFISSPNDVKKYAKFMANQALLDVALNSFNQMYFIRLSGSDLGVSSASTSSILSTMESEATRRFTNPSWYSAITDGSVVELTVLQEMAAMQAFQIWMQYQSYRQNERVEALLAANLSRVVNSSIVQDSMMPPGK